MIVVALGDLYLTIAIIVRSTTQSSLPSTPRMFWVLLFGGALVAAYIPR